jgi:microcystin-dependent protein
MKQDGLDTAVWVGSKTVESASTGEDEAHNNLPPYIALYYCKKN